MSCQTTSQTRQEAPKPSRFSSGFLQRKCACGQHTLAGDECAECAEKRKKLWKRSAVSSESNPETSVESETPGESRFRRDFSQVRATSSQESPQSNSLPCCPIRQDDKEKRPARKGDESLQSPRFKDDPVLQSVMGGATRGLSDQGDDIRRLKEALIDEGSYSPAMLKRTERDADSLALSNTFDKHTQKALRQFQRHARLKATGILDAKTLQRLDERFPPVPSLQNAKWPSQWTMECMLKILCPWNTPLVKRLQGGEPPVIKTDAIIVTNAKKAEDGTWTTEQKAAKGLADSDSKAIYLLKNLSCEQAAITLYHEMWHVDQPQNTGTLDKEVDAEFSDLEWAHGLGLHGAESYLDDKGNVSHKKVKSKVEELYQNKKPEAPDLAARINKKGEVSVSPAQSASEVPAGTVVPMGIAPTGTKSVKTKEWDCDPGSCRWCWPDLRLKLPKINFRRPKGRHAKLAKWWDQRRCKRRKKGLVFCPKWSR